MRSSHQNQRSKMDVVLLSAAILLCHSQICHAELSRPRIDERIIYDNDARALRPEYKTLTEDLASVGETIISMSLSFDVSESVKSLNLGDKSLAVEYLDNLHNKSSSGTNLSTKIDDPIDLVPLQFNTSCNDLGQAAGQNIALDYCPSSTAIAANYGFASDEDCLEVAISVCKSSIYGSIQEYGCTITTSQLIALQNECENEVATMTPSPAIHLITPTPTDAPELITQSPTEQPTRVPSKRPTKDPTKAPSKRPTLSPSNRPSSEPTSSPSSEPTTESPSMSPTDAPVTASPTTADPTPNPTDEPTETPTLPPSDSPSTKAPTRSPVEGPQPTELPSISYAPSDLPSNEPTTSFPSVSPTTDEPTPSPTKNPTDSPTLKPTISLQTFSVPTSMIFYTSDRLKGSVLETWKRVTSDRIKKYTLIQIGNEEESVIDCTVDLDIVSQSNPKQSTQTKLRRLSDNAAISASTRSEELRILQESTTPLLVNYTTIIQFYSLIQDWDANKFVASGFITNSQQRSYMFQLKAADTTNFDSLKTFEMEVDGTIVTDKPDPVDPEPKTKSTLIWAIIGAALGTVATAFIITVMVYVRKRNRRGHSGKSSAGHSDAFPDVEGSTKDETKPQASSYFGTIESREGEQDDVSTLGDPYFGEAVNAVMDTDETVAQSMISAEQDMYVYGVGRPRLDTGTTSSRMDTTISGKSSAKMMFNDDTTLEDVYKTPAMNIYDQEDGNSERITVVAPSGKLGIVIDNPGGDIPIVHAIKETSALNGRIKVGDFLLSVDERDCRGMSAVAVSKLISSRSENPSRTFVILRGSAGGGE